MLQKTNGVNPLLSLQRAAERVSLIRADDLPALIAGIIDYARLAGAQNLVERGEDIRVNPQRDVVKLKEFLDSGKSLFGNHRAAADLAMRRIEEATESFLQSSGATRIPPMSIVARMQRTRAPLFGLLVGAFCVALAMLMRGLPLLSWPALWIGTMSCVIGACGLIVARPHLAVHEEFFGPAIASLFMFSATLLGIGLAESWRRKGPWWLALAVFAGLCVAACGLSRLAEWWKKLRQYVGLPVIT